MAVDIRRLAHLGAQARLAQLVAEMDAILEAFPDLGGSAGSGRVRPPRRTRAASDLAPRRGRRRGMSAAQRKEVSRRMKAYWAKRRAQK